MTTEIDHLELELRSVPGVVAVGYTDEGQRLAVHVVAIAAHAAPDLPERVRKAVELCREPADVELRLEIQT